MATRKISDLTELVAGQVSSSDTLLLDNSDPTDQNKRSAVGSIFRALPGGSYTTLVWDLKVEHQLVYFLKLKDRLVWQWEMLDLTYKRLVVLLN